MPKVQCGVSDAIVLPVHKLSPRYANWPVLGPVNPHNRSLKSRLSLGVVSDSDEKLGRLLRPDGPACQKSNMASQCHRFR
ncbi:hypothetical protein DPMN_177469 [Dreissena polymorpha]|uniref:Uncharacterized protein n=1 Tax=Dreissena polymorpha TaxID=45954 RepID=A0A9D4EAA3_DREPO|nr:hypothetical protein DPMN_177469 [Dreissena polymorpha]